jgi:hypothetical protein
MAIRRKKQRGELEVATEDRLAPYGATQVPAGTGRTGLPPARPRNPLPGASAVDRTGQGHALSDPIIDLRESGRIGRHALDRRLEPRFPLAIPAAASHEGREGVVGGTTVDVSVHGMQLRMPNPPLDTHLDFVVGDEETGAVIWAKVVSHRATLDGAYHWHALVVSADDAWFPIVQSA